MSTDLTDYGIDFRAPVLPRPPIDYSQEAFDRFNNTLRLYFNQLDDALRNDTLVNQGEAMSWFIS
jgi:hypothetical protein|tara:strand:- start:9 stop:203 length:195 start_codon:yes stop_codon:yes gene_type:complete